MNTNDFSKCKIGDKLWSIQLGDCTVSEVSRPSSYPISATNGRGVKSYTIKGLHEFHDYHQSLFFSNPNIIAPPEPPRLPDYKPGQWIAVWDDGLSIVIRKFARFNKDIVLCNLLNDIGAISWKHHCTIEQLPEVLANWGEKK